MNRPTSYLLFALTTLTAALPAQTLSHPAVAVQAQAASPAPTATIIMMSPSPNSCPVGLRADPAVGLTQNTINTNPGVPSQTVTLELNNLGLRNVTRAQFTVHGLTGRGQVNPASLSDPEAATTSKQVELSFKIAHDGKASAPLLAQGFTSISWIELDSLTYADGSAWHASPQHNCSVVPNRFMLVATH
jgi:hypothetical protein